jgi:hypothetical protein
MATRKAVDDCMQQCENALRNGIEQYREGSRQEHYGDQEYFQAQASLQEAVNTIETLKASGNNQQKEQLDRMRVQIQQMQNKMILLDH